MENKAQTVWENCLIYIKKNIKPQAYKTWFEPIKPVKLSGENLTIQVPSKFYYEWLEEHYIKLLRVALVRELGENAKLVYDVRMENAYSSKNPHTVKIPSSNRKPFNSQEVTVPLEFDKRELRNPFVIPGIQKVKIESKLNPNYNFDNFVEGDANRLALSAGMSVANKPGGTSFNPLFIYGGVGLGKTHLSHAIGVDIKNKYPETTVLYISAEQFTQQYIDSVKGNTRNDFIHFYQMIDVLIIDDVQYLSGKSGTQDVFFHIFNHLHQNDKQIILTSDKAPVNLLDIEKSLLSRFKWGLSAELQSPDYETRISILQKKLFRDGVKMPDDIVEYIAKNIKTNVRELEGVLISMIAQASFNRKEFSLELVKQIVTNYEEILVENNKVYKHVIEMSDLLRNAFMKYLINFDEYVKDTKGISLEFQTRKNKNGIELEVSLDDKITIAEVGEYLDEYIGLIKQDSPNVIDKMQVSLLTNKIEFLELKYQTQVNQFKNDLLLADYKVKHLEDDLAYFKNIFSLREKEPTIVTVQVNQNQSQIQSQLITFDLEELNQIQDAFDSLKGCLVDEKLRKEADVIQNELDSLNPDNVENVKKGKVKSRFRRFFSKLKEGVDKITWTSKALQSFLKGKESLQKLAEYMGVDIKDVLEMIKNHVG